MSTSYQIILQEYVNACYTFMLEGLFYPHRTKPSDMICSVPWSGPWFGMQEKNGCIEFSIW